MKKLLMGMVAGGMVLFLWGTVSWMLLPWHRAAMHGFTNEAAVAEVLLANVPKAGIYVLPDCTKHDQPKPPGPFVFASIRPEGVNSTSPALYVRGLLIEMLGALLVTFLVVTIPGLGYGSRVRLITLVALIAGVLGHLPNWQWWQFSFGFTLVNILDLVIGYFLAGLVIAKIAGDA